MKVRDSSTFVFEDVGGRLTWSAADRGILTISGPDDLDQNQAAIVALVSRWMAATSD